MRITKTILYLLLIFFLALGVRIIAAHHTHVSTDEMVYSIIPLNIISAGRLDTIEQAQLFFYLTDLGYKLFGGITALSVRSTNIIFGSLIVFIVFLLSQELFNSRKTGFLSAFFYSLSGFVLVNNYEMDMMAFFFALLSLLFFIYFLKGSNYNLYLSSLFMAIAASAKPLVLFFLPAYTLVWLVAGWKKRKFLFFVDDKRILVDKKIGKTFLISLLIGLMVLSPIIIYNYLLYNEKGITNAYFSTMLGLGETVHVGMEGADWSGSKSWRVTTSLTKEFFRFDGLILLAGLLGVLLSLRENRTYLNALVLLSMAFFFVFLTGKVGGSNHFTIIPIALSLYAGRFIFHLNHHLKSYLKFKYFIPFIILLAIVLNSFIVYDLIKQRQQSITLQLRDYAAEEIPEEAIVVIDPRIYRGIHAWVFNDKHYLEGTTFPELVTNLDKISGEVIRAPLYYIECGPGTNCGWKPEDFQRIYSAGEKISNYFKEKTTKVREIDAGIDVLIYQGFIDLPSGAYEIIDRTHLFWFYPVGWKYPELAIDNYQLQGWENLLNLFAFLMLYLGVLLAILTVPFVFFLVFSKIKKQ